MGGRSRRRRPARAGSNPRLARLASGGTEGRTPSLMIGGDPSMPAARLLFRRRPEFFADLASPRLASRQARSIAAARCRPGSPIRQLSAQPDPPRSPNRPSGRSLRSRSAGPLPTGLRVRGPLARASFAASLLPPRPQQLDQLLRRGYKAKRLAGALVEPCRNSIELVLADRPETFALRVVLAQEPVGVLVRSPPPGTARIAEADRNSALNAEAWVLRHLLTLVPDQGAQQLRGQGGDALGECLISDADSAPIPFGNTTSWQ